MVHYGIMVSARIFWRFAAGFCPCDEIYFNTSWPKSRGRKQRTSWHLRTHTHNCFGKVTRINASEKHSSMDLCVYFCHVQDTAFP
jgi:hypothetical protein